MRKTTAPGTWSPGVIAPSPATSDPIPAWAGSDEPLRQVRTGLPGEPPPADRPGRWAMAWKRFIAAHPHVFDAVLASVIYLLTAASIIVDERMGRAPAPPAWVWIAGAAACAALLLRRRYPWVVLAVTTAGFLAVQVVSQDVPMLILAVVTALVTITLIGRRRAAIIAAVAITLFTMGIGTITDAEYWSHPRPLAVAALCALSIAAADAVRNRRAYIAAVEERARRAEASREQEAERRVGAERLRIARELHDVLAHHIAVINVQAGVAGHLLDRQPQQARAALDHVREAARSVLSEMQAVVTVLREPDEPLHPAEPIPGMDRLADLVDGFRAAGLTIDTVVSGTPTALPAAVDLVAYRTVQESLTNVHKHAGKTAAVVELDYRPDVFALTVTNAGTPTGSRSGARLTGSANDPVTGFGLLGMRERVGSVGGSLQAGPTGDGGFVTAVSLPVSSR